MKFSFISVTYITISTALLSACGGQTSEESATASLFCPGEKDTVCASAAPLEAGKSPGIFCYKTMTRDEMNGDYGVEISEEVRKSRDLLNGTGIDRRRTCSRAFALQNGRKVYLEKEAQPGSHLITDARPQQHYLLMSGMLGAKSSLQTELVHVNIETGVRKTLIREATPLGACNASLGVVASVSGARILAERLQAERCGFDEPNYQLTVTVFDAKAERIGTPYNTEVTGGSQLNWLSETDYQITDNNQKIVIHVD